MSHEPAFPARVGKVYYFTASTRTGDCEKCGRTVVAETPHRYWIDVSGHGHLRCTEPSCTPTTAERSAEVALWEPAGSERRRGGPKRMTLHLHRTEVCSRCGVLVGVGDPVLYWKYEHGIGKELLCERCRAWHESQAEHGDQDG